MPPALQVSDGPEPDLLSVVDRDDELIRRHQRGLWRYLRFAGADRHEADDLTQEAFVALLRSPPERRDDRAVAAWLRRTAYRLFCSSRRRTREEVLDFAEADAAWQTFVRDGSGDEASAAVKLCLETLPERMREALRLRYEDGGSRRRVAAAMALTADGAKTLLRRARQKLHACLIRRMSR